MTRQNRRGTAVHIGTFVPDSDEWHTVRRHGIGGSEIAAVVGLSPYESRFSLWHRKSGLLGPQEASDEMMLGHLLEEPIARLYRRHNPGVRVRRTGTWRHRDRPWQMVNPDRFADGRLLEIKWAPHSDGWGQPGTDEIPVYYRCQLLWAMDVFRHDEAILAALVANEYREYLVRYDADEAEFLREAGRGFLDTVREGIRPDIDSHAETYRVVRELHPDIDGEDIEIEPGLAESYLAAVAEHRDAEDAKRQWSAKLLDAMGTAKYAFVEIRDVVDGEPVTRRQKVADRRPNGHGSVSLYPAKQPAVAGQKVSTTV